jgi:NAD(P)-dependent dehydrogenase (short-subunit alcohol dehydrogenase family)
MPVSTTEKPHAGRVAVVTGAARGIGQAIAVGLARQGATVIGRSANAGTAEARPGAESADGPGQLAHSDSR